MKDILHTIVFLIFVGSGALCLYIAARGLHQNGD